MTFRLVDVGYSLSEGQAVKLIFFAPWYYRKVLKVMTPLKVATLERSDKISQALANAKRSDPLPPKNKDPPKVVTTE